MNAPEAAAVSDLIAYLLGGRPDGTEVPAEQVLRAAEFLAARARYEIDAGWRPEEIRPAWERRRAP